MERLTVRAEECVESTYEPLVSVEWRAEQAKVKNKKNDLDLSGFGITHGFQGFRIFFISGVFSPEFRFPRLFGKIKIFLHGIFAKSPES